MLEAEEKIAHPSLAQELIVHGATKRIYFGTWN